MMLSVIIATRNRATTVRACLDSVAAAFARAIPLQAEIVIVDNGSSDDTVDVIEDWAAAGSAPVRLLHEPKPGVSRARNHALRIADGQLLVFTDDDCRMHPEYVNALLRHDAEDRELVLRGGRVELGDPSDLALTINSSPTRTRWSRKSNSARREPICGRIHGCNMAMRRALIEQIGLFDETFGPGSSIGSGEDSDLIFRAYLSGATLEYVPDMLVFHHHGRKAAELGRELLRRYTTANGALFARYLLRDPDLCHLFYRDLRHSLRCVLSGRNSSTPDTHFSDLDMVVYAALGAVKYAVRRRQELPRLEGTSKASSIISHSFAQTEDV
jgi:glycosyltransferase involved in cell wall biosynthesis